MFVIPMAGLSSRFFKAGYAKPKYMLKAGEKTLFELAVESFRAYYETDHFIFIIRKDFETLDFINQQVRKIGIQSYEIIILDQPTNGQAETVAIGLMESNGTQNEEIYIFNIDTFRPNYEKPEFEKKPDGYLETFIGEGKNWSNIEPENGSTSKVKRTAEKQEISKYCCTGLYYWKSSKYYLEVYERYKKMLSLNIEAIESYVAPMYNISIDEGADIRYTVIHRSNVIFCGTPDEYITYIAG